MSTTASETFSTTLLQAADASGSFLLDNEEANCWIDDDAENGSDGYFGVDETEDFYFKDQDIEVHEGRAIFLDIEGKKHEVVFHVVRRLTLNDIILNRLTA